MSLENILNVVDLGTRDYIETLDLQNELAERRARGEIRDTLILVEHPTVITLGKRAKGGGVRASPLELRNESIAVHDIGRGGYSFLHSPGQIVGYPIRLVQKADVRRTYMVELQQAMAEVAKSYSVDAREHPLFNNEVSEGRRYFGTWCKRDDGVYCKVGAVGVQIKYMGEGKHVTMHGFAFNVNNDISLFKRFVDMCGFQEEGCISMKDILGRRLDVEEVKLRLVTTLTERLGYSAFQKYDSVSEILARSIVR